MVHQHMQCIADTDNIRHDPEHSDSAKCIWPLELWLPQLKVILYGLLSVSVRPYNPVHSVFVLALHLILCFFVLTRVRINDEIAISGLIRIRVSAGSLVK